MKLFLTSLVLLMAGAAAQAGDIIVLRRSDVSAGTAYFHGYMTSSIDPTYQDNAPLVAPTVQIGTTPGQANLEKGYPNQATPSTSTSYYVVNLTTPEMCIIYYWAEGTAKYYEVTTGLTVQGLVTDILITRTANTYQWLYANHYVDESNPPDYYSSNEVYAGLGTPLVIPASITTGYPVRPSKTIAAVPRVFSGKWYQMMHGAYTFQDGSIDAVRYINPITTTVTYSLDTVNTPLANNGPKLPVYSEATNAPIPGQFHDGVSAPLLENSTTQYAQQQLLNALIKIGYNLHPGP